jgi:N-methylhydantoinase A
VLAFGGAGPVHANFVAELLESDTVIFPPLASVLSAFGTLVTPVRLDLARGALLRIDQIDWAVVGTLLDEVEAAARTDLADAGILDDAVRLSFGADMRYVGQANEVTVDFPADPRERQDTRELREVFEKAYEKLYGLRLEDLNVEVVSWRVTALGPSVERETGSGLSLEAGAPKTYRRAVFRQGPRDVPVYDRPALAEGQEIPGPAIIEERETTIVILDGWNAHVDSLGCIIAKREG